MCLIENSLVCMYVYVSLKENDNLCVGYMYIILYVGVGVCAASLCLRLNNIERVGVA